MPDQPNSPTAVTWKVVSDQPSTGQGADGTYGQGHLVTVRISTGATGQVFVPNAVYMDVDQVRAVLADKAQAMAGVAGLTGTVGG